MYHTNKSHSSFKIRRGLSSLGRLGSFMSTSSRSCCSCSERPWQDDDSLLQQQQHETHDDQKKKLPKEDPPKELLPSPSASIHQHNNKDRFSRRARKEQLDAFQNFLDRQPKEDEEEETQEQVVPRKKVTARAA